MARATIEPFGGYSGAMGRDVRSSPFLFWASLAWAASTCVQVRRSTKPAAAVTPRWLAQLRSIDVGMETASGAPGAFARAVEYAARSAGIPPRLVAAVVSVESAWNPGVVSSAGAIGLMQLMPGTASELGVNPWVPDSNLLGGAVYLRRQLDRFDDLPLALAAYNAGPARAEALRRLGTELPAETTQYVERVLSRARTLMGKVS